MVTGQDVPILRKNMVNRISIINVINEQQHGTDCKINHRVIM